MAPIPMMRNTFLTAAAAEWSYLVISDQ